MWKLHLWRNLYNNSQYMRKYLNIYYILRTKDNLNFQGIWFHSKYIALSRYTHIVMLTAIVKLRTRVIHLLCFKTFFYIVSVRNLRSFLLTSFFVTLLNVPISKKSVVLLRIIRIFLIDRKCFLKMVCKLVC